MTGGWYKNIKDGNLKYFSKACQTIGQYIQEMDEHVLFSTHLV